MKDKKKTSQQPSSHTPTMIGVCATFVKSSSSTKQHQNRANDEED